ncbi:MAG: hypothetical protein CMN87_14325 [Stappia sp.]|nr:hypothetical protein [Stappia sp.]MBM21181.1 hypothetical protein [Stappia sp.]
MSFFSAGKVDFKAKHFRRPLAWPPNVMPGRDARLPMIREVGNWPEFGHFRNYCIAKRGGLWFFIPALISIMRGCGVLTLLPAISS